MPVSSEEIEFARTLVDRLRAVQLLAHAFVTDCTHLAQMRDDVDTKPMLIESASGERRVVAPADLPTSVVAGQRADIRDETLRLLQQQRDCSDAIEAALAATEGSGSALEQLVESSASFGAGIRDSLHDMQCSVHELLGSDPQGLAVQTFRGALYERLWGPIRQLDNALKVSDARLESDSEMPARLRTGGQKRVWEALFQRALAGKELAHELDTSEPTVRQWIRELRGRGYDVLNQRGRGYYRPDALPPDESNVSPT